MKLASVARAIAQMATAFPNPNAEDVFDAVYNLRHNVNLYKYPKMF